MGEELGQYHGRENWLCQYIFRLSLLIGRFLLKFVFRMMSPVDYSETTNNRSLLKWEEELWTMIYC